MASNPKTHINAIIRRDDLAKLREHWGEPIPIHQAVHELLLGFRQPDGASLDVKEHQGSQITPRDRLASAHLEACPLRAFPPDDLRNYRLTLDTSQPKASQS